MDKGKIFEKLMHLAVKNGITVRFAPIEGYYGRIKGQRIALWQDMNIDDINYSLAHELAHYYLHYDKGNIIDNPGNFEEEADRAAKMLLELASVA